MDTINMIQRLQYLKDQKSIIYYFRRIIGTCCKFPEETSMSWNWILAVCTRGHKRLFLLNEFSPNLFHAQILPKCADMLAKKIYIPISISIHLAIFDATFILVLKYTSSAISPSAGIVVLLVFSHLHNVGKSLRKTMLTCRLLPMSANWKHPAGK